MGLSKLKPALVAAGIVLATATGAAADSLSATVTGTSDYVFRGISQTGNDPALQGSLDYAADNGVYVGAWASTIDFGAPGEPDAEVDLYAGYAFDVNDLGVDVSAVYYWYPEGPSDYDYLEFILALSHDINDATWSGQIAVSPDYFGNTGFSYYLSTGLSVPLCEWLSLDGNVGYQSVEDIDDITGSGFPYWDWNVGLVATFEQFTFDLRYVDTNLSDAQCAGLCDAKVVASISFGIDIFSDEE